MPSLLGLLLAYLRLPLQDLEDISFLEPQILTLESEDVGERLVSHLNKALLKSHFAL